MIPQTSTMVSSQRILASTVFSILDSRIQFLEYQVNIQFDAKKAIQNHLTAYEQLMNFYHSTCKALKLLQILKEWVCERNASIVLELLQDDIYLSYSEYQLQKKIQIKEFNFA